MAPVDHLNSTTLEQLRQLAWLLRHRPDEGMQSLRSWLMDNTRPQRRYRVPGCSTCDRDPEGKALMPPHDASDDCESGKHEHCSCDTCF